MYICKYLYVHLPFQDWFKQTVTHQDKEPSTRDGNGQVHFPFKHYVQRLSR